MKPNEKRMIAILVVITAIVVIAFIVTRNKDTKGGTSTPSTTTSETKTEEYVTELSDGTKENTSEKLKETKTFDETLEVSGLKLTEKEGITQILGTIKNVSSETRPEGAVTVVLLDKNGEELASMPLHIKSLEPGETTQLHTEKTLDNASNAYDLKIVKE